MEENIEKEKEKKEQPIQTLVGAYYGELQTPVAYVTPVPPIVTVLPNQENPTRKEGNLDVQ